MKFEFKKTPVELDIYGQKFEISMPTEDQVFTMREKMGAAGEDVPAMLKVRREFLAGLGIPEDVLKSMEFKHVNLLTEGLVGESVKK